MKKLSIPFFIIILLLLTACSNDDPKDDQTGEETSSTVEENQTDYTKTVEETYQNMLNLMNYGFIPQITYQMDNQTIESKPYYQIDLEKENNGIVYYDSSYIEMNLRGNRVYYRLTEDVTTIFKPDVIWNKNEYVEKKENTASFMGSEGVIQKLLKHEYLEIFNNYTDLNYSHEEDGQIVLTLKNDTYKILEHPLVESLSKEHTTLHSNDLSSLYKEFVYKLYIDADLKLLNKIEVQLTPDFKVEYQYKHINAIDLAIPYDFDYYELADEETKQEFNELWELVNTTLNEASSFTLKETLKVVEKSGNRTSTNYNYLEVNAMEEVVNFSIQAKGLIHEYYMSLEEDGVYQYFLADEKYIKSKVTDEWLIEESDNFIIPIKTDIIRYDGISNENGKNTITYSYKLSAEEFFESDTIVYAIIEGYQNKTTAFLDDVDVIVELVIDLDSQTLSHINFDVLDLLKAIYDPGNTSIHESELTLYFENMNSVTIDTGFMDEAVLDADIDMLPTDETTVVNSLVIEEANTISMEYQEDTDVFRVHFTQPGKYVIHHDYESALLTEIVSGDQILLQTVSNQFAIQIQEASDFYFALTHYEGESGTLNYHIEKVTEDDYSDFYYDETEYPIGRLIDKNTISGNIDFTGDFDVFIIPNNIYLELSLISDQNLDLVVMGNEELAHITSGETLKSYLNETGLTHLYVAVFSKDQDLGAYTLNYQYEDESKVTHLTIGEPINGAIQYNYDNDQYQFTVNKNGKYRLEIGNELETDLKVTIFDSLNRQIGTYQFFKSDLSGENISLNQGNYTLRVESYFRNLGQYELNIQAVEDDLADTLTETGYPTGSLVGEETFLATINFKGDQDVIIPEFSNNDYYIIRFDPNTKVELCITTSCYSLNPINGVREFLFSMDHPYTANPYFKVSSDGYMGEYAIQVKAYTEADDLTDDIITENLEILTNPTRFVSMGQSDVDAYQLNIPETGYYNFRLQHPYHGYQLSITMSLYNDSKELISEGQQSIHYLEEGTYYIQMSNYSIGIMALEVELLIDDNRDGVQIEKDPTSNLYKSEGSLDFPLDQDDFFFTITDKDYYEFYLNSKLTTTIYDSAGNMVVKYEKNRYYTSKMVYLFPGDYTMKVDGDYKEVKDYTISFKALNSQATDDYWYDHRLGTEFIGELVIGTNTISIDHSADLDVYQLTTTLAGTYQIDTDLNVKIYDQNNDMVSINESNQLELEAGTYYFYLSGTEIKAYSFILNPVV